MIMDNKSYVLGLAFSRNKSDLVLIEKLRPKWQKGSLNGVGGKIENIDLEPIDAMVREFKEETGVDTLKEDWVHFATMTFEDDIMGGKAIIYCFKLFSNLIYQCKTFEDEEVLIFNIDEHPELSVFPLLNGNKIIKNLNVLIPVALDEDFKFCDLKIK